ncbi:cupin domain-containing protein [Aporhodopirellula aestuarii]|uniref:Cupin domain-containing protein n=1 Tax=Aporhodopirellula aestuarii TaxID=2950107 RepID=A0ABT0U1U1_9BACT|nr:cupin domain-containing protein [Aporhodopirellula aestuarii]MCM2370867.1 cupin domain-containing protein [Aporhodopirellula aestuarii]
MSLAKLDRRPRHCVLGIGYELMLAGAETDDGYELMRFLVPPGMSPPPHVHHYEDECFYLVNGQLVVQRGTKQISVSPGDSIHMPRGVPHTFRNESDGFAEFLCWVRPATLESFFAAFMQDWPEDEDLPPAPTQEHLDAMMASASEHHMEILL